jgi:peptide subunit release factor 1 (eRF1)
MTPVETSEVTATIDEHLERLLAFEPASLPVLSLYLDTRPDRHGRDPDVRAYLRREFKSLAGTWPAGSPERESFDHDAERILTYIDEKLDPAANGVAIFACSAASDFFEAMQLTTPIEQNRIYIYNQPHLYHLARLNDEYPRYAVLVTDANSARIFVFGLGQTIDAEEVTGKKVHRVKVGGWSQARYQRRVNNAHQQHAKEVIDRLEQIVREDNIRHIVLACDSAMTSVIQEQIPKPLAEMIVDVMKLDTKAPDREILEATLRKMREQKSKTDAEEVERLLQEYRAHGLAIVGPCETLEALANGQVDELLISAVLEQARPEREQVDAILAPEIPDSAGSTDSDEPREASLPDLLVTKAGQTDAKVSFIEDAGLLDAVGGVGAFLRWRN